MVLDSLMNNLGMSTIRIWLRVKYSGPDTVVMYKRRRHKLADPCQDLLHMASPVLEVLAGQLDFHFAKSTIVGRVRRIWNQHYQN
jgi:hypothetical protein